jgi:hypothetical protein
MAVERSVVERIQAKAVLRIQPIVGVFTPRDDVTGDEQFAHCQTGDATAIVVGRNDAAAEKALVHAHSDGGLAFYTSRRKVTLLNFGNLLDGFTKTSSQQPLAFKSEGFGVVGELIPDFFFAMRAVGVSTNPARIQCWVEAGEVRQLEGNRTRAAPQQSRQFDGVRLFLVDLAEGNFAVEVEREDVFLTRPVYAMSFRGHYSVLIEM